MLLHSGSLTLSSISFTPAEANQWLPPPTFLEEVSFHPISLYKTLTSLDEPQQLWPNLSVGVQIYYEMAAANDTR